jgi:hypothetical protein
MATGGLREKSRIHTPGHEPMVKVAILFRLKSTLPRQDPKRIWLAHMMMVTYLDRHSP